MEKSEIVEEERMDYLDMTFYSYFFCDINYIVLMSLRIYVIYNL